MARILVVDDDQALRRALSRYLVRIGFDVVSVGDYTRYREIIDPRKFDLVFLDARMPGMDGGDVYAALHIAHTRDGFEIVTPPPVVIITGFAGDDIVERVRNSGAGFKELLEKPFTLAQINEVTERCISGSRAVQNAEVDAGRRH